MFVKGFHLLCMKILKSGLVWFMVFDATFNNISVISWRSVFLVEETWVPGENHRPVASHWRTLSHSIHCIEYTSPWTRFELTNFSCDRLKASYNHFAARGANFWGWWFLWNSLRVQKLNDLSEIVLQCAIIQSAVYYLYSSILIVYQHSWALKRNVFIINRSNGSV